MHLRSLLPKCYTYYLVEGELFDRPKRETPNDLFLMYKGITITTEGYGLSQENELYTEVSEYERQRGLRPIGQRGPHV